MTSTIVQSEKKQVENKNIQDIYRKMYEQEAHDILQVAVNTLNKYADSVDSHHEKS